MFDWEKKCREMKEENEGREETMRVTLNLKSRL